MSEDNKERDSVMNDNKRIDNKGSNNNRGTGLFSADFCAALDNCNMPIYIIDPETFEMLYCNKMLSDFFGYDPTTFPCYKVLRNKTAPCEDCAAMRMHKFGDNTPMEVKTPVSMWVLLQASPLKWAGRSLIQLNCVDISKQKKLEEDLRLFNKEYGAVVRQSIGGVMRYDIATDTAATNVDAELNRVEECIIPNYVKTVKASGLIAPESMTTAKNLLADIKKGVPSRGYDLLMQLRSGNKRWCHIDYVLIRNNKGEPYRAVVSFFDSTEQREREAAYKKWSERLKSIADEFTGFIEVNLTTDTVEAESRIDDWERVSEGRCYSSYVAEMVRSNTIHEEDKNEYIKFFDRERLMGLYYAGVKESALEYRLIMDGEPKWFRAEFELIISPSSRDIKALISFKNIDENMRERERLANEAQRDSMTGLYNHAEAERRIRAILDEDTGERCCFLVIDLDDLLGINGTLGHPEGDRALKAIAETMKAEFGMRNILGRIGGDEFVVLLRDVPEASGLRSAISSFMNRLRNIKIGANNDTAIHVSVGGAIGTVGKQGFKTLYEQADLALYYTKATGKNAFNLYAPELEKRDFAYQPLSTVTLHRESWYESGEFTKMLQAISTYFPLVIFVNLTRNSYYMMEYMSYTTQKAKDEGEFDKLIADGASMFHPEDMQAFLDVFARENLIRAYEEGRTMVEHYGRQIGDDGVYRYVRTTGVIMRDEKTGDLCEVSFTHIQGEA